ncbi:hypothetical protein JOD64_000719 [Micromonospora luteifusca]|uniref:Uncharacterized protein n=1 Tax=Micromonospora luteifusca TaxID=709860 RepID=A0ABS2LMS5_9ACTN|nr:hypothetical protein [Micromonospora luteifusca]MBM7489497.1 hypothetical protein [Micromonospora luteifusca]
MPNSDLFMLLCNEGRFVPIPAGVFLHGGPMSEPVDLVALSSAMVVPRSPGGARTLVVTESALRRPDVVATLRQTLGRLPSSARDRLVLRTVLDGGRVSDDRADPGEWLRAAELLGLPRIGAVDTSVASSARVVTVDAEGRETGERPAPVWGLPRGLAAARETLRAAVGLASGDEGPSWDRLLTLLSRASEIRDGLLVRSWVPGDPSWGAVYPLAAGVALLGLPVGLDVAALTGGVLPVSAAQVMRMWGGPGAGERVDAGALVAALLKVPGSAALVVGSGGGSARWLVSHDGELRVVDARVDGEGAVRTVDRRPEAGQVAELLSRDETVLVVDPANRRTTVAALGADTPQPTVTPAASPVSTASPGPMPASNLVAASVPTVLESAETGVVRLASAVNKLSPWDGASDCADRVASVLLGLGLRRDVGSVAGEEGVPGRHVVEGLLGGRFGPGSGVGRLAGLGVGAMTAVWVEPSPVVRPKDGSSLRDPRPHMVLVRRVSVQRFVLVETQASAPALGEDDRRFVEFDLAALGFGEGLPQSLRGTARLVVDADGALRQVVVSSGAVVSGATGSGYPARLVQALVDPSPWPGEPGLVAEEIQALVRFGPGSAQVGSIPQIKTIAKLESLGIDIEVDQYLMPRGRSGRWYLSDRLVHWSDLPIADRQYRNIVRVVGAPGVVHEEEEREVRYTAEQHHGFNKAMIQWLMWAGRRNLSLNEAMYPGAHGQANEIRNWAELPEGSVVAANRVRRRRGGGDADRAAVLAVRDALLVGEGVWVDPEVRGLKFHFPADEFDGVTHYWPTVEVELAGIVHLLQASQSGAQGAGTTLAAMASVLDRVIHFSGEVADLFARSLTEWPLSKGNLQALLESEELLALRGAFTAVLTHVLARVAPLFETPEHGLFGLARQDLTMLVAKIPDETRALLQQFAGLLVSLIAEFDFFAGLERKPDPGWIDSPSTLNGDLTVREVLMAVFTGSREVRQDALFETAKTLPVQFPLEGTGWRWAFTLQHRLSDTGPLPAMGYSMTLDRTDEQLAATVSIARAAHDVARGAREWTQRWGGLRTAARIFSAAGGNPVPLDDGLFQGHDGRMWKRRELNGVFFGWYPPEDAPAPSPGAVTRSVDDLMHAAVSMLERVLPARVSPLAGPYGVAHDPEASEGILRLEMALDGSASPLEVEFPIISIQPNSWWETSGSDPLPALAARVSVHPDGPRLQVRQDAVPGIFEAEVVGAVAGYVAEQAGVDEPRRSVERVYWQNKALVSLLADAEPHDRSVLGGMRDRLLRLTDVLLTQWWPVGGNGDERTRELLEEVRLPAVVPVERGRPEAEASPLVEPDAMDLDADGELPQVDVVSGEVLLPRLAPRPPRPVVSGPSNSGQPSPDAGWLAGELETIVHFQFHEDQARLGPEWLGKVIAEVPLLNLVIVLGKRQVVVGRSGTWYSRSDQAARQGDLPLGHPEQWFVVKVVSAPAPWAGQVNWGPDSRVEWRHRVSKAMVRWLEAAATDGLTFTQAMHPRVHQKLTRLRMWVASESEIDRSAAQVVHAALITDMNVPKVLWQRGGSARLAFPVNVYPVNMSYRPMVDVEFAGIVPLLRGFWREVQGARPALDALGSVQDRVIQFSDMAAGAFVRSLSVRPLTESDVRVLSESQEVLAMRGVLAVVLTHVLAKVVTLPDDIEVAERPLFALTPQSLGSLVEGLLDGVGGPMRETAGGLVGLIAGFDFFAGLERKPVQGWIDARLTSLGGGLTAREVLMAVFTGSSEVTQGALFGEAMLPRWQMPVGGQQRVEFQRLHLHPGGLTTLEGTDGQLASTVRIAREADEVARKAKEWSTLWGGVRVAAQIFSAAHGDPIPFENDLYLGADGRLWKRNEREGLVSWLAPEDVAGPRESVGWRPVADLMKDAASLLEQVKLVLFGLVHDGDGAEGALKVWLMGEDPAGTGEPHISFTPIPYSSWWAAADSRDPLPASAARVLALAEGPRLQLREGAVAGVFEAEVVGAVAGWLAERAGLDEPRRLVERVYWQNRALVSLLTDPARAQLAEQPELELARGRLVRLAEVLLTQWWPVGGGGDERLRDRLTEVVDPQPINNPWVWMVSVPEVAPPSVEGVQAAVTLFRARYRQWMAEVVEPRAAATGDGLASEAGEALASVASRLEELRRSLGGLTPESRQSVWDRFVQVVRTYDALRSRLAEGGNPGAVPPAVGELLGSSQGAASGRDTLNDPTAAEPGRDIEPDGPRSVDAGGADLRLGPAVTAAREDVVLAQPAVTRGSVAGTRSSSGKAAPRVREVTAGSARNGVVRYQLSATAERWDVLVRIHLVAGAGVTEEQVRQVRGDTVAGVEAAFHASELRLPVGGQDAVGGADPVLRVGVEFVDSAERAHAAVEVVAPDRDDVLMSRSRWLPGRSPADYAGQLGSYLGLKPSAASAATPADLAGFVAAARPFLGDLAAWVAAAVADINHVRQLASAQPAQTGPAVLHRRRPVGMRQFARLESVVEGRPEAVRFTHGGRSFDVRVEANAAYSTPALTLGQDSARDAVPGRIPEAVLRVSPGLPSDELAGWLLWAGTRVAVERGSRGARLRKLVRYTPFRDGFGSGEGAAKRFSFGPGDLGRLAGLTYRLRWLEMLSAGPDPADEAAVADDAVVGLEADVVRDLAGLGVLRDQHEGGILRAEALGRWLRTSGLSRSSVELVRDLVLASRADPDPAKVVEAVANAAKVLSLSSPDLRGAAVVKDGDLDVLRLRRESVLGRPAGDEDIFELRIEVVPGEGWSRFRSVNMREGSAQDGRPVLEVRQDAGDAVLRLGVAGTLAGHLAATAHSLAGEDVPFARQLLAEHEALLDLRDGSLNWLARQLRKVERGTREQTGHVTFQVEMFDHLLGVVRDQIRDLIEDPDLRVPGDVLGELRRAYTRVMSKLEPPRPVSDRHGKAINIARRVGAAPLIILTTALAGAQAGRKPEHIEAGLVGQLVAPIAQGLSDAAYASMIADKTPEEILPAPDKKLDDSEFKPSPFGSPLPNVVKRTPPAVAQALASLFALLGMGEPSASAAAAVGMTVLATFGAAEFEYVANKREAAREERYDHERERTYDNLRNDYVESAYYRIRELLARMEATAQISGERRVDDAVRAELEHIRLTTADMMWEMYREVENVVKRLAERSRTPFRRSALAETYDLVARGVMDGKPSRSINAVSDGAQGAVMMIPAWTLGMLAATLVDLLTMNLATAAASSAAYGVGASALRSHEFQDLVAVASWDTLDRLRYIGQATTYLLAEGKDPRVTRPVAIDELADPSQYHLLNWLGLSRLTKALAQRQANDAADRPHALSGLQQILYKHLPSIATHMVTAGALSAAIPLAGPVLGVVIGVGAAARFASGLAETWMRLTSPIFLQTARIETALAEIGGLPKTRFELAEESFKLLVEAKEMHAKVRPVPIPADQGFVRGIRHMPRKAARRVARVGRSARRTLVHDVELVRWRMQPALGRFQAPEGPVRLSAADRAAVDRLYVWVKRLDHAVDPVRNARADLTVERVGARLVLLLDELGLRTQQDPAGHRWTAVVDDLASRHGYDRINGEIVRLFEESNLPAEQYPAHRRRKMVIEELLGQYGPARVRGGIVLAELRDTPRHDADNQFSRALRDAYDGDPLTAHLLDAVDGLQLPGHLVAVRSGGEVEVYLPGSARSPWHRQWFTLRVTTATATAGPDAPARFEMVPDDLLHGVTHTNTTRPHQLVVDPEQVTDPQRLAEILSWAIRTWAEQRGADTHRTRPLLNGHRETLFTLAASGIEDPVDPSDLVSVVDGISERVRRWSEGGVLTDEQFCVIALAAAREMLFPGGLSSGEVRDDRDVADVLWGGWGRPETWPLVRDVEAVHRLVEQRPGSVGFVARAWPGRIGHGYVVMHHAGKARWIDPQHSGVGGVWLLPSDTWPGGELRDLGERGGAREFDLRVLIFDVGNRAPIPIPDSALTAPPSRVVDALVDRKLYYQGTGNKDEQRDFVISLDTPEETFSLAREIILAQSPDGLFQIKTEKVNFFDGPDTSFYRSRWHAQVRGGSGNAMSAYVVERVSAVARSHLHEVNRPEPGDIYRAYKEMSDRTALLGESDNPRLRELFDGLGLKFSAIGETARLARGPVGSPVKSRFDWSIGVVDVGLRQFLGHLSQKVWRDSSAGFPTKASLESSLRAADDIARTYLEWVRTTEAPAEPDPAAGASMIAGHVAWLMHHAFAPAYAKAWGYPRGAQKQHLAFVARQQFGGMLRDLPPSVRAFLKANADAIWDSFKQWASDAITESRRRPGEQFRIDDDTAVTRFTGEGTQVIRTFFMSGLRDDVPPVDHRWFFGAITFVGGPDIARGALLRGHVVGEARGVGAENMSEEAGWAFHQELIRLSADAYERALVVSPQQQYADGQTWWQGSRRSPGVVESLEGDLGLSPVTVDELNRGGLAAGRSVVVVAADPQTGPGRLGDSTEVRRDIGESVVDRLDGLLRVRPELARQALFVVVGFHPGVHELRRRYRLSMVYPLGVAEAQPSDGQVETLEAPLVVSDAGHGPLVAGLGWRLVTFDNEVDDSLGPVLDRHLLAEVSRRVDRVAERALSQDLGAAQGPDLVFTAGYTAPDGTQHRWRPEVGREPMPGRPASVLAGAHYSVVAVRLLWEAHDGYRRAMGAKHLTTRLVLGNVERAVGSEQVADGQVWMLPSLQVAPPSVEGVQTAVTLFLVRYRQWLSEGVDPDLNMDQPAVRDAIHQLFTILHQLDKLRRALAPQENPTLHTGQRVWDQFVRVVRDYDGLRSRLMLSETQGVVVDHVDPDVGETTHVSFVDGGGGVPPSVDELMRSVPTAPTGTAGERTPLSLAPGAIPHGASTIGITQVGFQPSIFDKVSPLVPGNVRWRVLGEHEALPASLEDFLGSDNLPRYLSRALSPDGLVLQADGSDHQLRVRAWRAAAFLLDVTTEDNEAAEYAVDVRVGVMTHSGQRTDAVMRERVRFPTRHLWVAPVPAAGSAAESLAGLPRLRLIEFPPEARRDGTVTLIELDEVAIARLRDLIERELSGRGAPAELRAQVRDLLSVPSLLERDTESERPSAASAAEGPAAGPRGDVRIDQEFYDAHVFGFTQTAEGRRARIRAGLVVHLRIGTGPDDEPMKFAFRLTRAAELLAHPTVLSGLPGLLSPERASYVWGGRHGDRFWLSANGVPAEEFDRVLAAIGPDFDPRRLERLAATVGVEDREGRRQLIMLATVLRRVPDDLPAYARQMRIAPTPLFAVVSELGVDPEQLLPLSLSGALKQVIGTSTAARPQAGTWSGRLVSTLRGSGVWTSSDLVLMLRLVRRLGQRTAANPLFGELRTQGVSFELLDALPDSYVRRALKGGGLRKKLLADERKNEGAIARHLGLAGPSAVQTVATGLGVQPWELAVALGDRVIELATRRSVSQIVADLQEQLVEEGLTGPDQQRRFVTLSARIGFPASELARLLLPSDYGEWLLYELLGDVPRNEVATVIRALGREHEPSYSEAEIEGAARRLNVSTSAMRDAVRSPLVNLDELMALVTEAGLTREPARDLVGLADATGRVPTGLSWSAYRLGLQSPGELVQAALGLRIDPHFLSPLRGALGRDAATPADRPDRDELVRRTVDGYRMWIHGKGFRETGSNLPGVRWALWLASRGGPGIGPEGLPPAAFRSTRNEINRRIRQWVETDLASVPVDTESAGRSIEEAADRLAERRKDVSYPAPLFIMVEFFRKLPVGTAQLWAAEGDLRVLIEDLETLAHAQDVQNDVTDLADRVDQYVQEFLSVSEATQTAIRNALRVIGRLPHVDVGNGVDALKFAISELSDIKAMIRARSVSPAERMTNAAEFAGRLRAMQEVGRSAVISAAQAAVATVLRPLDVDDVDGIEPLVRSDEARARIRRLATEVGALVEWFHRVSKINGRTAGDLGAVEAGRAALGRTPPWAHPSEESSDPSGLAAAVRRLNVNQVTTRLNATPPVPVPLAWFDGSGSLLERVAQVREVLAEAAPQVVGVIDADTEPARDARAAWDAGTQGLARLAEDAKKLSEHDANAEFYKLMFTLDLAIDRITRLAPDLSNLFVEVRAEPKPSRRAGPQAPVPDRADDRPAEVRALGEWAGTGAQRLLEQIKRHAGGAGRPVMALDLSGASAMEAIRELGEVLREYGWLGQAPVLVATAGTQRSEEALAEALRASYQPVSLRQRPAGLDVVWELRAMDGKPVRMADTPDRALFEAAGALPLPPMDAPLPPVLAGWLVIRDWGVAEAYHRQHDAELRRPETLAALRDAVTAYPTSPRLAGFQLILEVTQRAGGLPEASAARLAPTATTVLELEPRFDPERSGSVPATFVYDYLNLRGRSRKDRFPMDGLLWQLMQAGELNHAQVAALVRTAAMTRTDEANATVFTMMIELAELDDAVVVQDPQESERIKAILSKIGQVTASRNPANLKNPDCVDPVDRAAWVPRLDEHKAHQRALGTVPGDARAGLTELVAHFLANC